MAGDPGNIRQEKIRRYIESRDVVTIHELEELCPEVSVMTIHRDLDALERAREISKFRGGARSIRRMNDPIFDIRVRENNAEKTIVAEKALALIRQNSSVFLDASTTNLALARRLPDMSLSIITTSPTIALALCHLSSPHITLCCGTLHRQNLTLSGQNTLDMLSAINIDLALVGVSGCSAEAGFTCGTEDDMRVKKTVIEKARTSVILCDHSKFKRLMPYTFCAIDRPDILICDTAPPEKIVDAMRGRVKIL